MSLTQGDLTKVRSIVRQEVKKEVGVENSAAEERMTRKLALVIEDKVRSEVKEQIGLLPTREEFFKCMDEVMTELKTIRQEIVMTSYRVSNHEERIGKLEAAAV